MSNVVFGVIGHIDHGKTALVRALTGTDTDRLAEEKRRGISIALGFAHLALGDNCSLDLIDMPGHERFVTTMVSGATGIDGVLVVVAANEGVKPQTVEHVEIASLLGQRTAVLAISKRDLVSEERSREVAGEAADLLRRHGFECAPPVLTAIDDPKSIAELRGALTSATEQPQPRRSDGLTYLPIDRAFSIAGHGTVVTGTLRGSVICPGDTLVLLPAERPVRVRAVQVHGRAVASGLPGQRVALNLRDVTATAIERGMALVEVAAMRQSDWLTIAIRTVQDSVPLENGKPLRALLGTDQLDVRLRLLDRDVIKSGESGLAQLHCARPVAIAAGEHVILRIASPARTVAGGRIIEPVARRRRRRSAEILQRLGLLRDLPPDERIAAELTAAGVAGTSLQHLSEISALAPKAVETLLQGQPFLVTRRGQVFRQAELERLMTQIPLVVGQIPAGLSRNQLLSAFTGTRAALLDEALSRLADQGLVDRRAGQVRIPRPEQDEADEKSESALTDQIAETLRFGGLVPPLPSAILSDPASRRCVNLLLRKGTIVRAVDRAKGKELLFHRDAIAEAKERLAPLLDNSEGMLVGEISAALGISRKFTMPLLAHLDFVRFTRRVGDRRVRHSAGETTTGHPAEDGWARTVA